MLPTLHLVLPTLHQDPCSPGCRVWGECTNSTSEDQVALRVFSSLCFLIQQLTKMHLLTIDDQDPPLLGTADNQDPLLLPECLDGRAVGTSVADAVCCSLDKVLASSCKKNPFSLGEKDPTIGSLLCCWFDICKQILYYSL